MTAFPNYAVGTVSIGAGATTVVGSGTLWTGVNARPGDCLIVAGHQVIIQDVTDATDLVIDAWPFAAVVAGTSYKIVQNSPFRFAGAQAMADVSAMIAALNTDGWYRYVSPSYTDPTAQGLTAADGQYAFQASTGKLWIMTAGAWSFLGIFKAFGIAAPWNSATAYKQNDVATLAGSSYICILAHTNQTPPNATYWAVLAAKGDPGAASLKPIAVWATATNYVVGPPSDYVSINGSSYQCLIAHTSGVFATDLAAGKWGLVAQKGVDGTNGTSGTGYGGTSTTSLAISVAVKSFTTQANLAYLVGARVRLSVSSDVTKYMEGNVTAYNSTTGAMTVDVSATAGAGTFASWNLNVAGNPGTADFITVRRFVYLATAGQTTFSGADTFAHTLAYTAGFIDVALNGDLLAPGDFTATDGTSVVLPRAVNANDIIYINASLAYNPADALSISQNGADIANKAAFRASLGLQKKNYIINGAMMVSQQNGLTAGTATGYFPVDQFAVNFSNGGAISIAQVASVTPGGSPNRIRTTVTTADAAVAAGDMAFIETRLEGLRISDLRFGSASAKTVTLQFGVKAPAGTYCVAVGNLATPNRSYIGEYTISAGEANTDVVKNVVLTGDLAGTWAIDNTLGMVIRFGLMAGTTFQQAAGAWGTTNAVGSSNQFNFMGTVGNVFELFDVSLTEGNVAPAFIVPDFAQTLFDCRRYWEKSYDYGTALGTLTDIGASFGFQSASTFIGLLARFNAAKRTTPIMAYYGCTTSSAAGLLTEAGVGTRSVDFSNVGLNSVGWGASLASAANQLRGHFVADARL